MGDIERSLILTPFPHVACKEPVVAVKYEGSYQGIAGHGRRATIVSPHGAYFGQILQGNGLLSLTRNQIRRFY